MEFRKMRRFKQELSMEESIEILKNAASGVLSLSGNDGYPYAVPLSFVYSDGKIIFHSAKQGRKIDLIKQNEKASFCVIAEDNVVPDEYTTYFKSVIAFGKVRIVEEAEELKQLLILLGDKYRPGFFEEHKKTVENSFQRASAIVFEVEHLTGKQAIELVK